MDLVGAVVRHEARGGLGFDARGGLVVGSCEQGDGAGEPEGGGAGGAEGVGEEVLDDAVDAEDVEVVVEELGAGPGALRGVRTDVVEVRAVDQGVGVEDLEGVVKRVAADRFVGFEGEINCFEACIYV